MNITLVQINGPSDFEIPELKKRSQESTRSSITKHYKALSHSKEVAFVSLDRWPNPPQMIVYEIFVPQFARRQGIATAVLNEIERISACEGLSSVFIRPSPLHSGITKDALIEWYKRQGYISDSSNPGALFKIIGFEYWYAHDKFNKAIHILATDAEDVRTRLLHVWQDSLRGLDNDRLPADLQKDFVWIKEQLHKFNEAWTGQLDELKQNEKRDPTFKENYAHLYPNPVEATLRRIHKNTGAAIARRIYNIYDALMARKWKNLTTHCIECRPQDSKVGYDHQNDFEITKRR